jgi:hypothetical protein
MEEVFDELGIAASVYRTEEELLRDLQGKKCVVLTDSDLSEKAFLKLSEWVEKGSVLIGFQTKGADPLFGIEDAGELKQGDDPFTINGYISLKKKEYLPVEEAYKHTLPVISPVRRILPKDAEVIGEMLTPVSSNIFQGNSEYAAITVKPKGKGFCFYFSYGLAQTVCVIHQGRPVDRDYDQDGMYRTGDGIVLTSAHNLSLPYADYHLYILQYMTDKAGIPSKHFLPPADGQISDLLLHYGGDDEADPSGIQRKAMEFMKSRGLPYHFNIMPNKDITGFEVDKELYDEIRRNGQECSLHFNFLKIREFLTKEEFDQQLDLYEKYYGETPVVTVNHCLIFRGWTEQARWASERGIKGDNSRAHTRLMPEANPVNVFGLAFGTTYPHFVYDDHLHGNRRLPYTYIPIAFYEARVRIDEHHEKDIKRLWDILQKAVDNAWTMNMFFHPVYIARTPECTEAIDQLLKFIEQTGYRSVHMGNDKLCLWWFDRSKSEVITEKQTEKELVLKVSATNKEGLVIRIPDSLGFNVCFVDEKKTVCERRKIAGRYCLLAVIPQGVHQVVLKREVPL